MKYHMKLLCVLLILVCLAMSPATAAVVVDQDLVWSGDQIVTGGGLGFWPDSPSQVTDGPVPVIPIEKANLNESVPDLSEYTIRYFEFQGQRYYLNESWEDDYPMIPTGATQKSNMDLAYSWELAELDYEPATPYIYFGLGLFVEYASWPLVIEKPGVTQHVTVEEALLSYQGLLSRNGVSSTAEAYTRAVTDGTWVKTMEDTSSTDLTFGGGNHLGYYRLDVTIDGETQSVYWGSDPSVTPTPTPTITPNATQTIPPLDNTTGFDPNAPLPPGGDPLNPDDLKIPDHIPDFGLEDWLNGLKQNSSTKYPLFSSFFISACNTIDSFIEQFFSPFEWLINIVISPLKWLVDTIVGFVTWLVKATAGFLAYLTVPTYFLAAVVLAIPPIIMNVACLLIILDAVWLLVKWFAPELNAEIKRRGGGE